jgi:hypothetical protein
VKIDVLAGEPQFVDHLAPVFLALPDELRGDFIVAPGRRSRISGDGLLGRAARRKVLAVTESEDPTRPVLVASWGDHKRSRQMGRTRIARMEHGIGQSFVDSTHPSYAGGEGCEDVGIFLVPNQPSADRWQAAYPAARVEVVGCPKLDTLPRRRSGPKPVVAVSFHWGLGIPKPGPLVESLGSFPEYKAALSKLAHTHRLIGHGHPRMMPFLERYYRRLRIPVVEDFADVCHEADLYVCDTNSTIYEFASTGRPVVVVNGKHFRRDVVHGLRFDWGPVTNVGVQCDRPEDLTTAVQQALKDTPEQQARREAALDIVYPVRSGAAELAAAALTRWLRPVAAVAA